MKTELTGKISSKQHPSITEQISVKIEGPRERVNELFSYILEKYVEVLVE